MAKNCISPNTGQQGGCGLIPVENSWLRRHWISALKDCCMLWYACAFKYPRLSIMLRWCRVITNDNTVLLFLLLLLHGSLWCPVVTVSSTVRRWDISSHAAKIIGFPCFPKDSLVYAFTLWVKIKHPRSLCDNFGKYGPILIILLLLHSAMNSGRSFCIIRHLTSNLLPHYLVQFECSTEQSFTIVIQFKSVQSRLFSVNIYRYVMISMTCPCWFIYNVTACVPNIRHQHADMLWVVHATCQWMRRWRVVQCWAKRLTDAVAIYCDDVTSSDVNGTQKRPLN